MSAKNRLSSDVKPVWLDRAVESRLLAQAEVTQWLLESIDQPLTLEMFLQTKIAGHRYQAQLQSLIFSQSQNVSSRQTTIAGQAMDSTQGGNSTQDQSQSSSSGSLDSAIADDATMVGVRAQGKSSQSNEHNDSKLSDQDSEPIADPSSANRESVSRSRSLNQVASNNWRQRTRELRSGFERYQVRQEIGRGGCGVVSTAFDTQMQRLVVIKQIIAESTNSETAARFLNEAQITGQLTHPGIVPVYEMGQDRDGMPFYAMKYLDGTTLTQCIQKHRGLTKSNESRASLHQLLQRFLDVCQTLAYAHDCGVIHRDLKPANVMIGQFGETVVLDWGLARRVNGDSSREICSQEKTRTVGNANFVAGAVVDAEHLGSQDESASCKNSSAGNSLDIDTSSLTQVGAVLGTAAYMSPEQARGANDELDQSTDVFSLGVMLYEILSGKSPFRGDTLEITIENVVKCKYQPLHRVNKSIPKTLAAICKKAMSALPEDRYTDANALADDLQNYLAGQTVSAYHENLFERLDRFADRHRTIVRSVFAVSVLVALFASISTGYVSRAHYSEQQAHLATMEAKAETEAALVQERAAHKVTNHQLGMSREAADNWMLKLSADLQFYPGLESIRAELFDLAMKHYQDLIVDADHALTENVHSTLCKSWTLATRLEMAKDKIRIADLHVLQGDCEAGLKAFSDARSELLSLSSEAQSLKNDAAENESLIAEDLGAGFQSLVKLQLANAHLGMAMSDNTGNATEWFAFAERTAFELLSSDPANQEARNALVRTKLNRGRSVLETNPDTAIELFQGALAEIEVLLSIDNSHRNLKLKENVLRDLGQVSYSASKYAQAERHFQELLRYYQQLPDHSQQRPDILEAKCWTHSFLASCLVKQGRNREAIVKYDEALEHLDTAWERLYGEAFYRENQSAIDFNQSQLLAAVGRYDDATESCRSAMNQLRFAIQATAPTAERIQKMTQIYLKLTELLANSDWEKSIEWDEQITVLLSHLAEDPAQNEFVLRCRFQSDLLKLEHSIREQNWDVASELAQKLESCRTGLFDVVELEMRLDYAKLQIEFANGHESAKVLKDFVNRYTTESTIESLDSVESSSLVVARATGATPLTKEHLDLLNGFAAQLIRRYPESESAWTAYTVVSILGERWSDAKKGLNRIKACRVEDRPRHQVLQWLIEVRSEATESSPDSRGSDQTAGDQFVRKLLSNPDDPWRESLMQITTAIFGSKK